LVTRETRLADLLEIIHEFRGELGLVDLEELDEDVVRGGDHEVFPDSKVDDVLFLNSMPPALSVHATAAISSVWMPK